jgi:hypothetical protein
MFNFMGKCKDDKPLPVGVAPANLYNLFVYQSFRVRFTARAA